MPRIYTIIILLLLMLQASADLSAEKYYNGLTVTASIGPSYVSGFYSDYFKRGLSPEIGTFYNLPFLNGNTYFTSGFSYYSYNMDSNHNSYLRQGDIYAGGMISYPLISFLFINTGLSIHGIYSELNTEYTERSESTLKPGVSVNLGGMGYLGRGIGLFANAEYRVTSISDERFNTSTIRGGITYNFKDYRADIDERLNADKKIALYDQGITEFRRKNLNGAKTIFTELHNIDSNYPGLDYYLKRIEVIEYNYRNAENLIAQKNYLRAIPYLELCSPYIKDCELKLFQQRKNLKTNIPAWEKDGIRFYDNRQYRECINIMEKILLVEPENRNANIYLPRAIKRNKAIETFQSE